MSALAAGGATESANFVAPLARLAERTPQGAALHVQGAPGQATQTTSWGELARLSARTALALRELGLERGDRACLFVRPGREWLALCYALLAIGAAPVLIDPGMGRAGVARCIARTRPRAFLGIPRAHLLRALHREAFRDVRIFAHVGGFSVPGSRDLEQLRARTPERADFEPVALDADAAAAVLFTSGATGPAKGVLYTHGMFAAQREALRRAFAFEPGEVDLACLPVFALFAAGLEWTSALPDMDFSRPASCDPARLVQAARELGATNAFGSPAIWKRVAPWAREHGATLPSLRRVLIAGAPVAPRLIESVRAILPAGADVHTPYGATEALPVADASGELLLGPLRARTEDGEGVCVGRPLAGLQLAIARLHDGPIARWSADLLCAPGELGEVCVKAPWVTAAYERDEEATRAAKIADPAGGFWHRMGDVGRLDGEGLLWFQGRVGHRLETERGLVMPVGLEMVFDLAAHVQKTAVVGLGPRGRERPVVVVQTERGVLPRRRALRERLAIDILRAGLWHPRCMVVEGVLFRDELPVDPRHNAKIDRAELKRWADAHARDVLPAART